MAGLLAIYAVMRLAIGLDTPASRPTEPSWDGKAEGTGIDASKLSGRVEQLRKDRHAEAAEKIASFKKPLMVEEKRREIEKLAFFQKPPPPSPPEPPEHEEGTILLFI